MTDAELTVIARAAYYENMAETGDPDMAHDAAVEALCELGVAAGYFDPETLTWETYPVEP